jgi:hypothetical protein
MANLYTTINGAQPTTAAPVKVATGTSVLTMLQITNGSTRPLKLVEWGCSFDASAAATPIEVELFGTTVAATSMNTGFVSTYDDPNAPASQVSSVQYWKTGQAEGTVANYRPADLQLLPPTNPYIKQWPLGREFQVAVSTYLRVRVTAGTSVNMYCYVIWEE